MKTNRTFFLLGFLLFSCLGCIKLSAQNCSNFDFGNNDFYRWTGKTGSYSETYPYFSLPTNIPSDLLPTTATGTSPCSYGSGFTNVPNRFKIYNRSSFPTGLGDPNTGNGLPIMPLDSVRETFHIPVKTIKRDTTVEYSITESTVPHYTYASAQCLGTTPIQIDVDTVYVRKDTIYTTDTIHSYRDSIASRPKFERSVRLGNACVGAEAEALIFRYAPNASSALLILNYALVLQLPNHSGRQNPSFQIHVRVDQGGGNYETVQSLQCAELDIQGDERFLGVDTAYHSYGSGYDRIMYRSWTKVGIDLSNYLNLPVEIEMDIGDCAWSGHYGYCYFSGSCGTMELANAGFYGISQNSDTVARITAPEGYTYIWTKPNNSGEVDTIYSTNASGQVLYLRDIDFNEFKEMNIYCELTSLVVGTNGTRCKANLVVPVKNNRPIPNFTQDIDPCDKNRRVKFKTTSIERSSPLDLNSIKWDFGDGITSREVNPIHVYPGPGTYTVTYSIASKAGIRATKRANVTIEELPVAVIDSNINNQANTSKICPDGQVKLTCTSLRDNSRDKCAWYVGENAFPVKSYTWTIPDTTCIKLVVTDNITGCQDSSFHRVDIVPKAKISFEGDSIICMGNTTTIKAVSEHGVKYWWNDGTQGASITKAPTSDTSFTVFAENEMRGCDTSKSIRITMTIPKLESTNLNICPGDSVVLTASGAYKYEWTTSPEDPNLSEGQKTLPQIIVYPTQTTTYSVAGMGQNGCTSTLLNKTVKVYPYPAAKFGCIPNYIDSENPVITFRDSSSAYTVFWDFGDGVTSQQRNPNHKYTDLSRDSIPVFFKASNELGCSDSITKYIPVGIFAVWTPNSFTPDASTNNTFKFYSKNDLSYYTLVIYDRWGQQVFESTNIRIGWDGTYKGKKCPVGSYVWVMSYKRPESDRIFQQKGSLNLIR